MNLYITADRIGTPTGGGKVTANELQALREMSECHVVSIDTKDLDPFEQDRHALACVKELSQSPGPRIRLAHCYSGCLTETVKYLKTLGVKVTYTVAAHDKEISRREHERLGMVFPYLHLTNHDLWAKYSGGYIAADVVVCPSQHAASVVRRYPFTGRIEVIPHGVDVLVKKPAPLPDKFTVGYLGAVGPDKGLRYLLEAWGKLNYQDGSKLVLAGRESFSDFAAYLCWTFAPDEAILLKGWVENVADFYDKISLYVQPSATEGFGIEVLEALAHGRMALASTNCCGPDVLPAAWCFPACDAASLAWQIDRVKQLGPQEKSPDGLGLQERLFTHALYWPDVRARYKALWSELLA